MKNIIFIICLNLIFACSSSDDNFNPGTNNTPINPYPTTENNGGDNNENNDENNDEYESSIISNSELNGDWVIVEHYSNNVESIGVNNDGDEVTTSWTLTGSEFEFDININTQNNIMVSSGKCRYDQVTTDPNGSIINSYYFYENSIYFPGLSGQWSILEDEILTVYDNQYTYKTMNWEIVSYEDSFLKLRDDHVSSNGNTTGTFFLVLEKK